MGAKDIDQERSIGAAPALAGGMQRGLQPTQAMEQNHVLCQRDHQHGGGNGFALDVPRHALAIPALVQLTQPIDDVPVKAQAFGQTLRHLTVTDEHGRDVGKSLHAALDGVINRLGGFTCK